MQFTTYLLGSFFIMNSIFRFSNHFTEYLFKHKYINLPIEKFEKINDTIYK